MKQIIPFNKDISFKTMIGEITAISLENTLKIEKDNSIKGDFIVSGSYKMTEASTIAEEFSYKIPVDIYIDQEYNLDNANIDIDDFNYSIVNDDTLDVKIDLLLDNISLNEAKDETEVLDLNEENKEEVNNTVIEEMTREDNSMNDDVKEIDIETSDTKTDTKVESLFNKFSDEEDSYTTYKVYIVRENDNIDSILEKYKITIEELKEYNDIDDLKINDKLIIPATNEKV